LESSAWNASTWKGKGMLNPSQHAA
jgi:hypothetical protein